MDETPPLNPAPSGSDTANSKSSDLAHSVTDLFEARPLAATQLFQAFFNFTNPGPGRQRTPDDLVKAAFAVQSKRDDHLQFFRVRLLDRATIIVVVLVIAVVVMVALLRDRAELVKTVFEGIGLILTHGVVGTGGYLLGKSRRSPGRRR